MRAWFYFHTFVMIWTFTYLSFNSCEAHELHKWIHHNLFLRETSFIYLQSCKGTMKQIYLQNVDTETREQKHMNCGLDEIKA